MTDFCTRITSSLRNGRVIVPLTVGLCFVALAMVLKNVLFVPAAQLSSDILLYIIIYMGFIVSFPIADEASAGSSMRTMHWTGTCILMTLGIIAVYAI
jgi:hypothetical protein